MKRGAKIQLVLAGCLVAAPWLSAQDKPAQNKPPADAQKPAAPAQPGGNPFPEDTSTVPVMPNAKTPVNVPDAAVPALGEARVPMPAQDSDPVRSPDDAQGDVDTAQTTESSSSLKGMESLLPPPDEDVNRKPSKKEQKEPTHQEAASKDLEVGQYYLERKDWKAALSRYQSAMVLDPENPEVYWGLAVAQHHLGDFVAARADYLKLLDYDPDGPHGKAARKAMKEPEIANAQNAAKSQAAQEPSK